LALLSKPTIVGPGNIHATSWKVFLFILFSFLKFLFYAILSFETFETPHPQGIYNNLPWVVYSGNVLGQVNYMYANLDLFYISCYGRLFFLTGPFSGCPHSAYEFIL